MIIKDICKFYPKSKIKAGEGMEYGKYPFYTSSSILSKYLNSYEIEKDGIILGTGGSASIHYCEGKFSVSTDCLVMYSNDNKINNEYLYYYLLSNIYILEHGFRGAGLKHISKKYIEDIEIKYIPNLPIQQKIIEVIKLSRKLIDKRKEQIETLDELIKSKFNELFNQYFCEEYITNLMSISDKITDGEHGTVPRVEKGIPYLMARNININNQLDFKEVSYIEEKVHEKIYSRCNPEYDDLLIVCVGATIGKVTLVPKMEQFSLARSVALVKYQREKLNGKYLLWLFNHNYMKIQLKNSSNESAQAGLYIGKIKELKIPVPPMELQNEFADFVKQVDKLKSQMETSLKELEDNFNSLMQKAFKGEMF